MPTRSTHQFTLQVSALLWAVLVIGTLMSTWAGFELRGLHADGAGYLVSILREESFAFNEPSRRSVHFVQQLPTVLALRVGIFDVRKLTVIYGVTMQLLPLVFLASCYWILPRSKRVFLLFPVAHYLVGTLGAFCTPLLEGPVAAAYFWPLFFILLFRFESRFWMILLSLASIALLYMHEVYVFLGPLLALASGMSALRTKSRAQASVLWVLTGWYLLIALFALGFILDPRSPSNRDNYLQHLLSLRWLITDYGGFNAPMALGILALGAAVIASAVERFLTARGSKIAVTCLATCFAGLALGTVVMPFFRESTVSPVMQFMARNHPAFVSALLAPVVLLSVRFPAWQKAWSLPAQVVILGLLALGSFGWHGVVLQQWSGFIQEYEGVLSRNTGLVSWESALNSLEPEKRLHFERMSWSWTNPAMSLLLSPGGKVAAIVDNPEGVAWEPFNPKNLDKLPRIRLIELDAYKYSLRDQQMDPGSQPENGL